MPFHNILKVQRCLTIAAVSGQAVLCTAIAFSRSHTFGIINMVQGFHGSLKGNYILRKRFFLFHPRE